jgi:hypothetical protein
MLLLLSLHSGIGWTCLGTLSPLVEAIAMKDLRENGLKKGKKQIEESKLWEN